MRKLTQAEFLAKAVAAHGVGRYDYSQAVYAGSKALLTIICPTHGPFRQAPNNHCDAGQGCPICGVDSSGAARLDYEAFLVKAHAAHGNRFAYAGAVHKHGRTFVRVVCSAHGEFLQAPHTHINSTIACQKCYGTAKFSTEEFIARARAVHDERYDYSSVNYSGNNKPVTIGCPVHGDFEQSPAAHIRQGAGCPKCGASTRNESRKVTAEEFIARAKQAHGNRYDYSGVNYTTRLTPVTIGCPVHGDFEQTPAQHMNASGCPKCGMLPAWTSRVRGRRAMLYVIRLYGNGEDFYKVGVTARRIADRCSKMPYTYELLASYESLQVEAVADWEASLHATFDHLRYRPKVAFAGASECFVEIEPILSALPVGTKFY